MAGSFSKSASVVWTEIYFLLAFDDGVLQRSYAEATWRTVNSLLNQPKSCLIFNLQLTISVATFVTWLQAFARSLQQHRLISYHALLFLVWFSLPSFGYRSSKYTVLFFVGGSNPDMSSPVFIPIICHLCNLSVQSGVFPSDLTQATVLPGSKNHLLILETLLPIVLPQTFLLSLK